MPRVRTDVFEPVGFLSKEDRTPPVTSSLFRSESLKASAAQTYIGQPIPAMPFSWGLITIVISIMIASLASLLFIGSYNRKEAALGIVQTAGGDIRIMSPAPGTIKRTLVTDGAHVRSGDTLLIVDTLRSAINGRPFDHAILSGLNRELASLNERLISLDKAAEIERKAGPIRVSALNGELLAVNAQERSSTERLSLAEHALEKLQPVADRGFISGETIRRRTEEVIALRQSIEDARGLRARLTGQLGELHASLAQQPSRLIQKRGELQDAISRVDRERNNYLGQRGFTVKSPVDGIVSAVQATEGQHVEPQHTLMTVNSPRDNVLAEVFVASRAIGFIKLGQEVEIRYDAFPYQQFGSSTGKIRAISSVILRPDEIHVPVKIEEPVYRILVDLNSRHVFAYGQAYRIRPGLALTANITLEKRSFAGWLLDPLKAFFRQS